MAEERASQDLLVLLQKIRKAKTSAEDNRCVDLLCLLKSLPVTAKSILDAQAGKQIQAFQKNPNKKIQVLASEICNLWIKRLMCVEKSSEEIKKVKVVQLSHNKRAAAKKLSSDPPKSGNPFRDKIREAIHLGLCRVFDELDKEDVLKDQLFSCDPAGVAISLEEVLFQNWGSCNGCKKNKYRSLLFNIKDPKNKDFRKKLLVGQVKADRVVQMSSKEMASDGMQHEIKLVKERALMKCITGSDKKDTTDEPMTAYVS